MASFSRSFKPGSFMAKARRPDIARRTNSSSSMSSLSSVRSEDQFVLSQGNTPITENPPTMSSTGAFGPAISITSPSDDQYRHGTCDFSLLWTTAHTVHRVLNPCLSSMFSRILLSAPVPCGFGVELSSHSRRVLHKSRSKSGLHSSPSLATRGARAANYCAALQFIPSRCKPITARDDGGVIRGPGQGFSMAVPSLR